MPKYPEGSVSPTGKFIVRGGQWVAREAQSPAQSETEDRPSVYTTAETLHRDEQGRTLSFPHQATPSDPEGQAYAGAALALGGQPAAAEVVPAVGAALASPTAGGVMGAIEGFRRGGIEGAMVGAAAGYAGVGAVGKAAKLLKFVSRLGGGAKAAEAATVASKAAAGEMSQGELLAALRGMSKPAQGYVENPSVGKVAQMMRPTAAAPAAAPAAAMTEKQLATQFAPGQEGMKDIAGKIISWRKDLGLSPGQIADTLREQYKIPVSVGKKIAAQVIEGVEGGAAKAAPTGLQVPRIQVGAQNVGRTVGMTKEEVRKIAGPVLDEALGEASPILPKQALQGIIDKMRSIPMAEREAYVAKATSGKTKWQVENIRRTLEHLGLLLPIGAAGMAASKEGQ